MLAENDDPDLRMRRPQLACEANAFVRVRRRHPDVGHDGIRLLSLDRRTKLIEIVGGRDQLAVFDRLQNARDPFPGEETIVTEYNPDHRRTSSLSPQCA